MRTIRRMSLTVLVMLGLLGVGSYFATHQVHDATSDSSLLFVLAWTLSGLGVVVSAIIVGACLNSENFGKRDLISELFSLFGAAMVVTLLGLGLIAGLACGYVAKPGATDGSTMFDVGRFVSIYVSALLGLTVGFFGILGIHAKESWIGQSEESQPVQLRRAS